MNKSAREFGILDFIKTGRTIIISLLKITIKSETWVQQSYEKIKSKLLNSLFLWYIYIYIYIYICWNDRL